MLLGKTMIRHVVELSGTVATIPLGMQGATTGRRLIASPSFPLPVAAGFLRAGSDAVDLAAVTSPTNKNLTSTASAQKHPARSFLHTCRTAGSTCRKPALCFSQLQQSVLRLRACPSLRFWPKHSCFLNVWRARQASACGYVDNARALPTYPQAQQATISIDLIDSE
jgi:hypothetical protein